MTFDEFRDWLDGAVAIDVDHAFVIYPPQEDCSTDEDVLEFFSNSKNIHTALTVRRDWTFGVPKDYLTSDDKHVTAIDPESGNEWVIRRLMREK